jgi:hypothetical protein
MIVLTRTLYQSHNIEKAAAVNQMYLLRYQMLCLGLRYFLCSTRPKHDLSEASSSPRFRAASAAPILAAAAAFGFVVVTNA